VRLKLPQPCSKHIQILPVYDHASPDLMELVAGRVVFFKAMDLKINIHP